MPQVLHVIPHFDALSNSTSDSTSLISCLESASLKDPYKIGLQSYKWVKAKGLVEKVAPSRRTKEIEQKIDENKVNPQSPQVFEKRPIAQAFKVTKAERKVLWEEMHAAASQVGFGY